MKPFNLKKALAGHPLVTRDGREAIDFKMGGDRVFPCKATISGIRQTFTASGEVYRSRIISDRDLFLASPAPSKPRPKSETRKNVERVRAIMGRNWITLADIWEHLVHLYSVNLPEQSVSARVRDLRKDEFGAYDIRKKQIGKGLYAYRNFGKKGAVK